MKSKARDLALPGLLGISLLAAAPASAATTIYTSQTSFLAALQGITVENFNDNTLIPGLTYSSSEGVANDPSWPGVFHDFVLGSNYPPVLAKTTTFNFATAINGFGGNFDFTENGPGEGISFTLTPGGQVSQEIPSTLTGQFWGFISDTAFSSVLLQVGSQGGYGETYTLDNLTVGTLAEAVGVAPEPASWAMLLSGFGIVGMILRRARRRLAPQGG